MLSPLPRRQLLALAGVAGVSLLSAPVASAREVMALGGDGVNALRRGRSCVVQILLKGGNDALGTVIPLGEAYATYAALRPTLGVASSAVLRLDAGVGFHPALAPLMPWWERGALRVHLGAHDPSAGSHVAATAAWYAAARGSAALRRRLTAGSGPHYALSFGEDHQLLSDGLITVPLATGGDTGFTTQVEPSPQASHRTLLAERLRSYLQQALPGFPSTTLGDQLRQVASLLVSGLTPSAVLVTHQGYDTHSHQAATHAALLGDLASSLSAFAAALQCAGRWDAVTVVVGSEGGRSAVENAEGGTEHGPYAAHLVLGGRVAGGVQGAYPAISGSPSTAAVETVASATLPTLWACVAQDTSRLASRA